MKRLLFLASTFLIVLGIASTTSAYLLNGDFETTTGNPYDPDYTGLVHGIDLDALGDSGNKTWDVYQILPGYWDTYVGPGIEIQKNTVVHAHSGDHYVELDSHGGEFSNSGMFQLVELTAGLYDLSFWYRPRTNTVNDNGIKVVFMRPDNTVLFADGISSQINDWVQYSISLMVEDDDWYGIGFQATGIANTLGGFIDTVSLNPSPVPEPATMLLLGVGLLGVAGFNRKFKK